MLGSAKTLYYVTRNLNKFREANSILKKSGIHVVMLPLRIDEIQDVDVVKVARFRAKSALKRTSKPILVEDSGLYVEALNGFPGALSSYVYKTIGIGGILKLMRGVRDRQAYFRSAVVYSAGSPIVHVFVGRLTGTISVKPLGGEGFGFDPIFIPRGYTKTLANLGDKEKNKISHRARALTKFANCFLSLSP